MSIFPGTSPKRNGNCAVRAWCGILQSLGLAFCYSIVPFSLSISLGNVFELDTHAKTSILCRLREGLQVRKHVL